MEKCLGRVTLILNIIIYIIFIYLINQKGKNINDLIDKVIKFELSLPDVPIVSPNIKTLLAKMLIKEE